MIDFSKIKKLTVDGIDLKSLAINGIQVWKSGPKNWVPYSTESDGVTIYNGGLGYKDGYRVRSGGAEATHTGGRITGFIRVNPGDKIRCTGWNFDYASTGNAVNYFDSTFGNLGQFTSQPKFYGICTSDNSAVTKNGNVFMFVVPSDSRIQYLRFTAQEKYQVLPPEMIVTINEEIE